MFIFSTQGLFPDPPKRNADRMDWAEAVEVAEAIVAPGPSWAKVSPPKAKGENSKSRSHMSG